MQLLIFCLFFNNSWSFCSCEPFPFGWWAQMDFLAFGCFATKWPRHLRFPLRVVGSNGLGPSTSRLSGVCSNQLSYEPIMVEVIGFEPMTPCLQGRCSTSWAIPPTFAPRKINAPPFLSEATFLLKTNKKETNSISVSTRNGQDRQLLSLPLSP